MMTTIYSRKEVERLIVSNKFPAMTAVISFFDPEDIPVEYEEKTDRVFYVPIHDIDLEVLENYGFTYDSFFPEVQALAGFILDAKADGYSIICQCEYGQSRSAACAAAILEYFHQRGITIFADYRYYPNQLVFNKLYDALCGRKDALQ